MTEIIVTGERISRSLHKTESSVEVFDSSRLLREPAVHRLDDLYEVAPNVLLGNPGQGPTIRGQDTTGALVDFAAFLGGTRPRMTLNIDGRSASYNEFVFGSAPLWDVAQVEIFRSPQSTVEGRNSIAGATYIRTNSPTFDWRGAGRLIADAQGAVQASAMANATVVEDALALRLAADMRQSKPWSDLRDTQRGADPDHDDYGLVRVKLLATPQAFSDSRFEIGFQHLRSKAPQTVTAKPPFNERRDNLPIYGIFSNRITSATFRAELPLTSTLDSQSILSLGKSKFTRHAPIGRGEAVNRVADRSFETRMTWQATNSVRIRGGAHVLGSKLDQEIDLSAIVGLGSFDDRQSALGLFGEIEVRMGHGVTGTASVRRQSDRQRRKGTIVGDLILPVDYDKTFTFWLPRFAIGWDLSEQLRVGGIVQKASNPGGASLNFITGQPNFLDAETLWNFEVFGRARLFEGKLSIDANLFRNEHEDAQRAIPQIFVGPRASLTWYELYNVNRARSEGLEVAIIWTATPRFTARAGLGLLRTKIGDNGEGAVFNGKSFARAPKRSIIANFEWKPFDNFTLTGRVRHHSGYFSDDLNSDAREIEAGTEADLRIAYAKGPFTIHGYARNVTNEFAVTYMYSATSAVPNRPREIGVGLETRF